MGQQVKAGGGGGGGGARPRPRYRYLFLLGTACGAALLLLSVRSGPELQLLPAADQRPRAFDVGNPFTIDTEGCTIPGLKPFDEDVKAFVWRPEVDPCRNANFTLLQNNETHIWIQKEYLRQLGVDGENVSCCYKSFYRPDFIDDITSPEVDNRVQYNPCIHFSSDIKVSHEFVKVICEYELPNHELGAYKQLFLSANLKPLIKRNLVEDVIPQTETGYNVIIMGLDAISRLNFHRTMPKTAAYLKSKGGIELKGYNKVGDNTFPNLTPLLLGIRESELQKTCWPHTDASFDNCPFVWEWFKNVGYYTALAEDNAKLGTFNWQRPGFIRTPTDYYARTFMLEGEQHSGNNMDFNCFLCMGNKYFYKVLLDYVERLAWTLRSSKLFGFFWEASMSHDYLNYPMAMDDSYEKFLEKLDSFQYLDDTILIFLSDHGIRWGKIRLTKQGRLEERLPLVYILAPPSFRKNYSMAYDNLRVNSGRLTTPFDVHATLVDLASMSAIKNENIKLRSATSYAQDRGISLFLPIPRNRTCSSADIDEHWCTCHKGQKMSPDSEEAREAGANLVRHLNTMLREHPECARLKLAAVLEVTELIVGKEQKHEKGWHEYLVVVRVEPGGGVFEATLRRDAREWKLAGTVSRLNLYGHQSHCVHHYRLKLYCYCQ